jgi:hypothetical protein
MLQVFLNHSFPQKMQGIFRALPSAGGSGTEKKMIIVRHAIF